MNFDFSVLSARDRYKLLTALVVPRPIALVSTLTDEEAVNVAPYSFFNVFSQAPPICALGIERRPAGSLKDTAHNIERRGEFVVNLVNETIAEAMNICAVDFPSDHSELTEAGLTTARSETIATPRVAESPASLECKLHTALMLGTDRRLVVGEILGIHVDDSILDKERLHIDFEQYRPIGRLFGNGYCRTRDTFKLRRRSFDEWLKGIRT